MRSRFLLLLFILTTALVAVPSGNAQDKKGSDKQDQVAPKKDQTPDQPEPFSEVEGSVNIAGKRIDYTVVTGRLPVKDMTGKAGAKMFFMAYTKKNEQAANRPLMFCFNGGPGSASLWVHLGFFGPRRVQIDEDGKSMPLPARLIENEYSMLDMADLVFIDPISTGFSRSDDPKDAKLFHGLEEDTSSVGDFIKAYVTKYGREKSPTYIAGESYGTTRSASLSSYVQNKGGVNLAGIMLISVVLDFETINFGVGNDLPYTLFLPTYTAAAFHHKKLDAALLSDLKKTLAEAQQFANGPYTLALRKGNLLSESERKETAKTIAKYTGLTEDLILKSDLRVSDNKFRSELLKSSEEVIGRYDSRVKAKIKGGGKGKGGGGDPSNALLSDAFGDSIRNYLVNDLKNKIDLKYNTSGGVNPWNYGNAGKNRYVNVAPRLKTAMEKNKNLRVLVANGYMDLATPFSATQHTFAHFGPPSLMDRVTLTYYEAGHMMYTHQPSLRKLRDDTAKFITPVRAADKTEAILFAPALAPQFHGELSFSRN